MKPDPDKIKWDTTPPDPDKVQWNAPAGASAAQQSSAPVPAAGDQPDNRGLWDKTKDYFSQQVDSLRTPAGLRAMTSGGFFGNNNADVAMGVLKAPLAVGQLATKGLAAVAPAGGAVEQWANDRKGDLDDAQRAVENSYKTSFDPDNTPGSTVGQIVGESLAPLGAASKLAKAVTTGGRIVQGTAVAAGTGALQPVDAPQDENSDEFWKDKLKQIGVSVGTAGAVNAAGRVIGPATNEAVRLLNGFGVTTTPGQTLGGAWKALEDKMTSIPLLGDMIKSGQVRSMNDFNRAVYKRTLEPLGEEGAAVAKKAPLGSEGIQQVGDYLSNKYDQVLAKVTVHADPELIQGVAKLQEAAKDLPQQQQQQFTTQVNRLWNTFTDSGLMSGTTMKAADTKLGQLVRQYGRSGAMNADHAQLADVLRELQSQLRQTVARSSPKNAPTITAINQGWANLTQLEKAGATLNAGKNDGIFTPNQYLGAVKSSDNSVRDRAFSRNEVRNQDLAKAGAKILPNQYPDSGSVGRAMIPMAMAGAAHLAGSPLTGAAIAGAGVAGSLPYTPWGQKLALALLAKRPDAIRAAGQGVSAAAPLVGGASSQAILAYLLGAH